MRNGDERYVYLLFVQCNGRFEGCWPAIMQDADGIIFVYNPEAAGQTQEIGDWYEYFARQKGLSENQCLILAHHRSNDAASRFRPRTCGKTCVLLDVLCDVLIFGRV